MHSLIRKAIWATLAISIPLLLAPAGLAQIQVGKAEDPTFTQEFVPGEILVKFKEVVPVSLAAAVHEAFGSRVLYVSSRGGFQRVGLADGQSEAFMANLYASLPFVEYAELNTICRATMTPNDTYYSYQWHFPLINMPAAWDDANGSGAVVAILDSGVAYENYTIPSYEAAPWPRA